ncbi:MAG: hypothetical protein Greene041662_257 [Candidatus Peregrinibacteria bacterium Greene0416_62]|nr:MAG: hypothetical protein Greene041662_257 [Candidatus Peregrinibacteria bacterium Greene0416_62]TSC99811.1 MAG: hypothetical protein Greene101449_502 [Candidatus Peregrinibacteria bacterium Greene1014_49]
MASVPSELRARFKEKHPLVPDGVITEAARAAGEVNGGVTQVRGLVAQFLLEAGHSGEDQVRQYFPHEAQALIAQHEEEAGRQ